VEPITFTIDPLVVHQVLWAFNLYVGSLLAIWAAFDLLPGCTNRQAAYWQLIAGLLVLVISYTTYVPTEVPKVSPTQGPQ
jgi:Na+-transporting NADH:ubiquinone oxidoreductase subunit NqrB